MMSEGEFVCLLFAVFSNEVLLHSTVSNMMYFETHIRMQFITLKRKYQIIEMKTTCVPWGTPVM